MRCGRGAVPKPMRIPREGAQLQIRGMWSAGPGDNQARFLADLRALRDSAAIGYDELAARAHYPSDILKEAENGPRLPGLPVLTAYVRACDGDVLGWEERWRNLSDAPGDPSLPVRPAGASPAAVAGARAGVSVAPPDVYDPERIKAALRGDHGHSGQASRGTNDPGISAPAQGPGVGPRPEFPDRGLAGQDTGARPDWAMDRATGPDAGAGRGATPGWDAAAGPTIASANGNRSARHDSRGPFEAAVTDLPDSERRTETAPADSFTWFPDRKPAPRPAESDFAWLEKPDTGRAQQPAQNEPARPQQADTWRAAQTADSGFAWLERADAGRSASSADTGPARPEPGTGERASPHQDGGLKAPERTDFWATSVKASADLEIPAARPSRAEEPTITRASWPAATAQPSTSAQSAGSPAAQATVAEPEDADRDRFFPVRLLVVILIAALIGSALVFLIN